MRGFLSRLLSSTMAGRAASNTKKEERVLSKKEIRAIADKYKLPVELDGSSFLLLLFLLAGAAIFQSSGYAVVTLFQGSLYALALMAGTAALIHLFCRIRKDWNEDDFTFP